MAGPIILSPPRYSRVPWLTTAEDLTEGREACWSLELRINHEVHRAWAVTVYADKDTETHLLVMHATRGNGNDGGEITLAIQGEHATPPSRKIEQRPSNFTEEAT